MQGGVGIWLAGRSSGCNAVSPPSTRATLPQAGAPEAARRLLVVLLGMVDRVLGDLDGQVFGRNDGLAAQPRLRLQSPGPVEQIVLALLDLVEGIEPLAHDAVTGRAGTAHVAGMLDLDAVVQQGLADRSAGWHV